jgi:lysophospholipase L1-like esterase
MNFNSNKQELPSSNANASKSPITTPPTKDRLSVQKKAIFFLLTIFLSMVMVEVAQRVWSGFRTWNFHVRSKVAVDGVTNDCEAIVFSCLGDSMTFGLGAPPNKSYPMQIGGFFEKYYPGMKYKVYCLGFAGTNTSEGLQIMEKFFQTSKSATVDYALIMYGINNLWNLHESTIWKWDETINRKGTVAHWLSKFKFGKFVAIAAQNNRNMLASHFDNTPLIKYKRMLDDHGPFLFFSGFDDPFLAKWVETDLNTMVERLRMRNVEPILITYHFERYGHLNPLIRQFARNQNVVLLDIEMPASYYHGRHMFYSDNFHLNTSGYKELAKQIMTEFHNYHSIVDLNRRLEQKKRWDSCFKVNDSLISKREL